LCSEKDHKIQSWILSRDILIPVQFAEAIKLSFSANFIKNHDVERFMLAIMYTAYSSTLLSQKAKLTIGH